MNKFLSDPRHRFETEARYRESARPRAAVEAPLTPEQSAALESWCTVRDVPDLRTGALRVVCVRPAAGWVK